MEARKRALEALSTGKLAPAVDSLQEALTDSPTDLAAFTFHSAGEADRTALRLELDKAAETLKPIETGAVAPPQRSIVALPKVPKLGSVTLKRVGQERHDGDSNGFLERTKIHNPFKEAPGKDPLVHFPNEIGELFQGKAEHHEDHVVVHYGPALVLVGDGAGGLRGVSFLPALTEGFKAVLKPAAAPASLPAHVSPSQQVVLSDRIDVEVRSAKVVGSLLVAQLSHEGDELSVKPDGFLVGFDLATDKVAWVSDAGLATGYGFFTTGAYAVVASGSLTATQRYEAQRAYTKLPPSDAKLSVIDLGTGRVVASAPLADRPTQVFGKGDRVFAWSDESVETFEITAGPPAPKVELGSLSKLESQIVSVPVGPHTACWLRNAAVALDHRDAKGVLAVAAALPADTSLHKALTAAGEFLAERAAGQPGLDLTEVTPVALSPHPVAKIRTDGPKKVVTAKSFAPVKETELLYENVPAPVLPGKKPPKRVEHPTQMFPSGRSDHYPRVYGVENIQWAYKDGDDAFLSYGQRYVAVVKRDAVVKVVDLLPFGAPKDPARGYRPLAFVSMFDRALLLVTQPQVYDPKASTAFLASVDPVTGATLWRTEAGVLARHPLVFEEYVVTVVIRGSGSELVAYRRHDGQLATRVSFPDLATDFGWESRGAIFVTLPKEKRYFTFK